MSAIRNFITFLSVARHGSFSAAAAEVCLTQPAVSLQMRTLERELGMVLFERGPRSVSLSVQGHVLLPLAERLVANYDEILHCGADADLAGTVRVGALVSALMGAFSDAMLQLKKSYPRLDLKLFTGLSSDFAVRVERGELDLAIVTESPVPLPPALTWTALYTEPMVLITAADEHRTDPGVLLREPFIRFDRHTWTGVLIDDALRQLGAHVSDIMELNSIEAISEMVRRGFGVSIVPLLANSNWNADAGLRVVALPERIAPRRVGLLERRHHSRTAFSEAIKRHFDEAMAPSRRGEATPAAYPSPSPEGVPN